MAADDPFKENKDAQDDQNKENFTEDANAFDDNEENVNEPSPEDALKPAISIIPPAPAQPPTATPAQLQAVLQSKPLARLLGDEKFKEELKASADKRLRAQQAAGKPNSNATTKRDTNAALAKGAALLNQPLKPLDTTVAKQQVAHQIRTRMNSADLSSAASTAIGNLNKLSMAPSLAPSSNKPPILFGKSSDVDAVEPVSSEPTIFVEPEETQLIAEPEEIIDPNIKANCDEVFKNYKDLVPEAVAVSTKDGIQITPPSPPWTIKKLPNGEIQVSVPKDFEASKKAMQSVMNTKEPHSLIKIDLKDPLKIKYAQELAKERNLIVELTPASQKILNEHEKNAPSNKGSKPKQ